MAQTRKDLRGRVLGKGEARRRSDGRYVYAYTDTLGSRKYVYAQDLVTLREKEAQLMKDQMDGLDIYVAGRATVNFVFDRYMSLKNNHTKLQLLRMMDRFADKEMKNNFYRLLTCKEIRNAAAYSNCILNDLKERTVAHKTNTAVTNELMILSDMNSNFRKNRMSNAKKKDYSISKENKKVVTTCPYAQKWIDAYVEIEPLLEEQIDFETFSKSDFRAVKVKECVAVPKSKKLLQFTLDDGSGTDCTILSGIHAYYEPEELVGKSLIAITNLPPRKIMGIESCGMLLSAVNNLKDSEDEELHLLIVDNHIPAGANGFIRCNTR